MSNTIAKMTSRLLKWSDFLAILSLITIAILSLVPRKFNYPDAPLISLDLVLHFGCYFTVGLCALYRRFTPRHSKAAVAGLVLFGGMLELLQSQLGRSADVMDFIANALGVIAACMLVSGLRKVGAAPAQE